MTKVLLPIILAACAVPVACTAAERSVPLNTEVETLSVSFNDEVIKCFCLLIDARSREEKAVDDERGHLAGPVIVFFQGHAQRPDDAYEFTGNLALLSRSGIVIVPVCDTPYGSDNAYHGDQGKDVVLMELVRHVLAREGLRVSGFEPVTGMRVLVNGVSVTHEKDAKETKIIPIGWSHGGILARRCAHAYKASVSSLGQVCPAGYEAWGSWGITRRFAGESLRIVSRMGNGQSGQTLKSAWGFLKGFAGDLSRSVPAAVVNLHPGKLLRIFKDIKDCTVYCDSTKFTASHLERISVIFGRDDSCMSPERQLGIKDPDDITREDLQRFQTTFFSDVNMTDGILKLRILPGTHLAPVTHNGQYARTLLADLGELAGN